MSATDKLLSEDEERPPPDELDALLLRMEIPLQNSDGRGTQISETTTGSHRKSYSVGFSAGASTMKQQGNNNNGGHRKNMSSFSAILLDALDNGNLDPIHEDIEATAEWIKQEFVEELEVMDQGKTGFFDTTMTRDLSILPDNIPDLAVEVGVKEEKSRRACSMDSVFCYLELLQLYPPTRWLFTCWMASHCPSNYSGECHHPTLH